MSQAAFQTALARLVTEADFRERARAEGESAFDSDLTDLERRRLASAARAHGLDVTASLVASYRLGKILGLLPMTRVLLGDDRLVRELKLFWEEHPPTSFYAPDEALAFGTHVLERHASGRLRSSYVEEVVGCECALIELRRPCPEGKPTTARRVRFHHDPAGLLTALAAGRRPRGVRELPCTLTATLGADGLPEWSA